MDSDTLSGESLPDKDAASPVEPEQTSNDEPLPIATVISGKRFKDKPVTAWQFSDLEQEERAQEAKVRSDVMEQIRREAAPELEQQAKLVKKEAYEKAQKEGHQAGYEEGLELGRKEAFEKAEKEAEMMLSQEVKSIHGLLEAMASPYENISQDVFQSIANLSIELAKRIVKAEVSANCDWVINAIQEAMIKLPDDSKSVEIEIHPDDFSVVEQYLEANPKKWQLVAQESIPRGACRLRQNTSIVVNDWQARLDEFLDDSYILSKSIAKEPNQMVDGSDDADTP